MQSYKVSHIFYLLTAFFVIPSFSIDVTFDEEDTTSSLLRFEDSKTTGTRTTESKTKTNHFTFSNPSAVPSASPSVSPSVSPTISPAPTGSHKPTSNATKTPTLSPNSPQPPVPTNNSTTDSPVAPAPAPEPAPTPTPPVTPKPTRKYTTNPTLSPAHTKTPSPTSVPQPKKKGFFHYVFQFFKWVSILGLCAGLLFLCYQNWEQISRFLMEVMSKLSVFCANVTNAAKSCVLRLIARINAARGGDGAGGSGSMDDGSMMEGLLMGNR
mmetsp:Transcript_5294/g.6802  ORF Transcript_5294/g.6802 Transcript_5294/m.6802 type:complete len:268 (-) Transcript_5294:296-1099(-)